MLDNLIIVLNGQTTLETFMVTSLIEQTIMVDGLEKDLITFTEITKTVQLIDLEIDSD